MKIFITGATGFIGKTLVKKLAGSAHEVSCLVRPTSRVEPLRQAGFRLVTGNVNDPEALRQGMEGCDWVLHLANLYTMWHPEPAQFRRVNVEGTYNVMRAAVQAGVGKVVYVSTAAVYGRPADLPFSEDSLPGPRLFSEYGRTKALGNQVAWQAHQEHGLPLVVLYPGIVLGAGDDKPSGKYISDIIQRRVPATIFHHSTATYVYVGDVADAILRAAERPDTTGKKYLLGNAWLNGKEYVELIRDVSGVPLPWVTFPDWMVMAASYLLTGLSTFTRRPPRWGLSIDASWTLKMGFQYDGSKAERELGITYTPIRQALEEAIASYRAEDMKDPKF
jgi:dihydroflavonol-4-reductase